MESLFTSLPLLKMSKWGGTDASMITNGIDSIFSDEGTTPLSDGAYKHKVIGCTSDGASVNFRHISGLMKRMANGCDWLISFHCVNHHVELGIGILRIKIMEMIKSKLCMWQSKNYSII